MKFSLIVPVYNEELTIMPFYKQVRTCPELQSYQVEIIFINDGSNDTSEALIEGLCATDDAVKALHFTRNFGKEAALFAGLKLADADAVIPMDVDLQDPVDVTVQLINKWLENPNIETILAKRIDRSSDNPFKRTSARLYYKFYNLIAESKLEVDVGDFRLIARPMVERIIQLNEHDLFMKGIYGIVGGSSETIYYARSPRIAGQSKFRLVSLFKLGFNGLLVSSSLPIRIWIYLGLLFSIPSFIIFLILSAKLLFDPNYPLNSVFYISDIVLFVSGIQLTSIGVIGQYIWKIYNETRNRPRYFIKHK